jgi:predicted nucleotidyltransferase
VVIGRRISYGKAGPPDPAPHAYGATRLILFGSALIRPEQARDLDLACDGVTVWKLYQLGARLEEELRVPLDLVPLTLPTRFTRLIERRSKVLL